MDFHIPNYLANIRQICVSNMIFVNMGSMSVFFESICTVCVCKSGNSCSIKSCEDVQRKMMNIG